MNPYRTPGINGGKYNIPKWDKFVEFLKDKQLWLIPILTALFFIIFYYIANNEQKKSG
jgi:hypothetical protein